MRPIKIDTKHGLNIGSEAMTISSLVHYSSLIKCIDNFCVQYKCDSLGG